MNLFLALGYKEWMKTRRILGISALAFCMMLAYTFVEISHAIRLEEAVNVWYAYIFQLASVAPLWKWLPSLVGLLVALSQFVPEMTNKRLKLTLHLPVSETVILVDMLLYGLGSLYYKEIGLCALDILRNVPVLVSTVNKAKFSNKLLCLNELGNLVAETQQLVGNFVNIVNNARIPNPLQGQATAEKKNDGYNLLDRYERLTLANSIYTDLNRIRYKVEGMVLMAQYATANDLFFAIDPEGWANVVTMKNHVGNLVQDWNGLVASNY